MPFNAFKDFFDDVRASGSTLFARIKDKDTFRRVVYAGFLIARADGNFDANEKSALARLIHKDLSQFKIDDITAALDKAAETIEFDTTLGKQEILADIAKAKDDAAELIMRTAVYIGGADGNFDDDEKVVAREICQRLGLNAADYGL